ncbi:MAG: nucleotide 5'-monophosphate nucleosidase PpnN [Gammaproteobacteria bacterium]
MTTTAYGIDARVTPAGSLELLSQHEVLKLRDRSMSGLYDLFRRCCLAVLNSGQEVDDARAVLAAHEAFEIAVVQQERGVKLDLSSAPSSAFVDGDIIKGTQENLFAVMRDILFVNHEIHDSGKFDLEHTEDITNAVFHILRNAGTLVPRSTLDLTVCWGGHSISRGEYAYTKRVGYELGLRGLNVITGCGPGAMKGPMKGATIGHSKQRIKGGRYIGITEPSIIAAEAPNPIVNDLVIMPDIEKRLEAFVRAGHGVVVFPGGAGTAEEVLYLLGILLNPANADIPFPFILTAPAGSAEYMEQLNGFIGETLGDVAQSKYRIVIDDPAEVARAMRDGFEQVRAYRKASSDAYYYNWGLTIEKDFQIPFEPTHEAMASLDLSKDQPVHELAANLRRAFSGIVAGNVKEGGIAAIEKHGPFELSGDRELMTRLDTLLRAFVAQKRMKLGSDEYKPCYRLAL